jgi:hypothetical protein
MSIKNLYTEARPGWVGPGDTENIGTHREFHLDNSNSLLVNKWGKENNKFSGDFGSSPCLPSRLPSRSGGSGGNPCTKNEDQLSAYPQDKQDPNPRTIRNS